MWSVASDKAYPQQRRVTRSDAQIRWACRVKISANVNVHKGSAAALRTAEPYMCGSPWLYFDIFTLLNTLICDYRGGGEGELYWGQKWDVSYIIAVIIEA